MAFDRSKFKGGSRKAQKEVQASEPVIRSGNRSNWHYVQEGRNEFRLAPPHNPEHSSYELYRTATIDCNVPVWENGEKTDKTEVKPRKIISATVHSESLKELGVEGDVMELYCKLVKDWAYSNIKDKKKRDKHLAPLNGYRGSDGKWVWGITAKSSFLAYAWSGGELGLVELYSNWVRDMDKLAAELEEDGQVIEIDPFSNVDEGYPLIIMKDKNKDGKWEYVISKAAPSRAKKETYDDFFERTALTDDQLSQLASEKSLHERYVDSYRLKDFELALNGLKMFDEKNSYGIFEDESFLDKCETIHSILEAENRDEEDGDEDDPSGEKAEVVKEEKAEVVTPKKVIPKKVAKPKKVEIDKFSIVSKFINDSYGDGYDNQIPTDEEELDKWYKLSLTDSDLPLVAPEDFVEEEEQEEEEQEEEMETKKVSGIDLTSQIANLRNRRK
tara:strand:+ start:34842 stop:36173 length:1332 start_codon:yes stop_codon:yes gene_type:complete